jgi:hypothetical protein
MIARRDRLAAANETIASLIMGSAEEEILRGSAKGLLGKYHGSAYNWGLQMRHGSL